MRQSNKLDERGFTVIELALVLLLMVLFSMAVLPRITDTLQTMRLRTAAEKLAADVRYARELALSYHDVYGIEFNMATNSYQVFSWNGATKTVVADPFRGGSNLIVDFDDIAEYNGVTISAVNSCAGLGCLTSEVRVDAFGIPYDGNDNAFTAPASVTLSLAGANRIVRIQPETAYTEII